MYATVIAKGVTDFANNCELLKYGLHWDAVISRWAREHANEVGALDVTKNSDIYKYIAVFYLLFPFRVPTECCPFGMHMLKSMIFGLHSDYYFLSIN